MFSKPERNELIRLLGHFVWVWSGLSRNCRAMPFGYQTHPVPRFVPPQTAYWKVETFTFPRQYVELRFGHRSARKTKKKKKNISVNKLGKKSMGKNALRPAPGWLRGVCVMWGFYELMMSPGRAGINRRPGLLGLGNIIRLCWGFSFHHDFGVAIIHYDFSLPTYRFFTTNQSKWVPLSTTHSRWVYNGLYYMILV